MSESLPQQTVQKDGWGSQKCQLNSIDRVFAYMQEDGLNPNTVYEHNHKRRTHIFKTRC